MKTSGVRVASLFRQVGLIADEEWRKHFQKNARPSKRLVDILMQDVSWQTFVDLANLEIRLTSRRRRSPTPLPSELTQPIHIRRGEILQLLQTHRPDAAALCKELAHARKDKAEAISRLLEEMEEGLADPYRELVDRSILTPEVLSGVVQGGSHPAARRNRRLLALEILALNNLISQDTRDELAEHIDDPHLDLGNELQRRHNLTSKRLAEVARAGVTLPTVDPASVEPDEKSRSFCPTEFLRRELFLPFQVDGLVWFMTSDPLNLSVADILAILTDRPVLPAYAPPAEIIAAINRVFPPPTPPSAERQKRVEVERRRPPTPVQPSAKPAARPAAKEPIARIVDTMSTVELVSSMIESAVATKATDIHLEPQPQGLRVRFRIDGQLHNVMNVPSDMALPVISRIKVLANMNVTERRRPQDGHFALEIEERTFDFRVSAMPSHLGEKLVLRILDEATVLKGLGELGLDKSQQDDLARLIQRPFGLLLVTGPTGSGKTTTLYSALSTINRPGINITTIEDPVEYQLEGITQVQVDYAIDLDFASGLRAALRQDPDVIMVGEIRDTDTARIAIRAALTGHLVFSTLHTNQAVGAIAALYHMGIQSYLIASALAAAVAQRLVKKICKECKRAFRPPKGLLRDLGLDENLRRRMYRGKGCSACLNTGYSGRTGVFEILKITEPIRRLIIEQASDEEIEAKAHEQGFRSLREYALDKVFAGITSPDEVLRTIYLGD